MKSHILDDMTIHVMKSDAAKDNDVALLNEELARARHQLRTKSTVLFCVGVCLGVVFAIGITVAITALGMMDDNILVLCHEDGERCVIGTMFEIEEGKRYNPDWEIITPSDMEIPADERLDIP